MWGPLYPGGFLAFFSHLFVSATVKPLLRIYALCGLLSQFTLLKLEKKVQKRPFPMSLLNPNIAKRRGQLTGNSFPEDPRKSGKLNCFYTLKVIWHTCLQTVI